RREDEGFEAVALARSRAPPGGEVAALVELGEFAGVELVDDVDRLRGDPEGRHELVEGDEVLLRQAGPADEDVELHPEEDLVLEREGAGEVRGDRVEILAAAQGADEELLQLGV